MSTRIAAMLTEAELRTLHGQGFIQVAELVPAEHAKEIRESIKSLFERKAGNDEGAYGELTPNVVDRETPNSPQIHLPANYDSSLHDSLCFKQALAVARQILGPDLKFVSDIAILKSSRSGAATPWHQDEAFRDPHFRYVEVTIWVALQEVDDRSGCLAFIPGTHKSPVHRHRTPGGDPESLALECIEGFDKDTAVLCSLHAGGCTIHFPRTVHCSTPNVSENARIAYAITFGVTPTRSRAVVTFSWLDNRIPILRARRRKWMLRGGWAVAAWRRLRRGDLKTWNGILYWATRAIRSISRAG
jgi:ectoine hydroxylase-related dioxygenase (phytanoyl-CoA dioxygenase family)